MVEASSTRMTSSSRCSGDLSVQGVIDRLIVGILIKSLFKRLQCGNGFVERLLFTHARARFQSRKAKKYIMIFCLFNTRVYFSVGMMMYLKYRKYFPIASLITVH